MIGEDAATSCRELIRQLLHPVARGRIDDARPGLLGKQGLQLAQRVVARGDAVADIGPVEPGDDEALIRDAELGEDIGAGVAVCRGGERKARDIRETVEQRAEQAVVGPEIVAPFGNAMRFIDREQRERRAGQQFAEMRLAGAFGGDIEQIELAGAEALDGRLAVHVDAGQRGGGDPVGIGGAQLIMHQRDERRDDDASARQQDGRELIGERLARAGGHDRQRRLPGKDPAHDLILHAAKGAETEHARECGEGFVPGIIALERHAPRHGRSGG